MSTPFRISTLVGALIAIVLQLVVAPNIQIVTAMPNFILCYVIAIAVANARNVGYIMPFILGLVYDLLGAGPVGAMACICVVATAFASGFFRLLDNETLFIPIAIIVCVCIASDLAYGLLTIACGLDVSLVEALVYVALPCALYDIVMTLIAYPLVMRFVYRDRQTNEMTIIDSKID